MARTAATEDWATLTPTTDEILSVEAGILILSSDADPATDDGTSWRKGEKVVLISGVTYSYRRALGPLSAPTVFDRIRFA